MNEINYWEQFCQTGKINDYLRFKEQTEKQETMGEQLHARSCYSDRDDHKSGADGRI